jgi:hypothetical protein
VFSCVFCIAFAFFTLLFSFQSLCAALKNAPMTWNPLRASEEVRKKPEKDASCVEDLRRRLQAAEDTLSDKEAKQVEHENAIIKCFETQYRRFSSTSIFPFVLPLFLFL